jgi:L-iditol 2-dehydrogenase
MTRTLDLPQTSRAAVITGFNEPIEIWDLPLPDLEPGGLLVRVEAATICGSDLHVWDGSINGSLRPIDLPVLPGHEMTGEIVALGEGRHTDIAGRELQLGDRILFTQGRCGSCYQCTIAASPNLCSNRRNYGTNCEAQPYLVGGFSEYCYVYPESRRITVPASVKPEWASAASCAVRSVVTAFERLGPVEPWQTVVVQGAGPLGLFATAMASVAGAGRIIVVGDPEERLRLAKDWGADDVVSVSEHPDEQDRVGVVRGLTGGQGAEIVMEFSGARTAFGEGLAMTRRGGRFLVAGQVGPQEVTFRPTAITQGHLTILGSFSGAEGQYWKALRFLERHRDRFDVDRILSAPYALHEITDAFRDMQEQRQIKPVIHPGG